jgi:hypothetical protein
MTANYQQLAVVNKRVRFYDGQFLQDQDFIDEQKYHIDRQRRHNQALHVSGIACGLEVAADQPNQVTVAPGTAVDRDGRLIVLAAAQSVKQIQSGESWLYISYAQEPADIQAADKGVRGETRWNEAPYIFADGQRIGEQDTYKGHPDWTEYQQDGPPPVVVLARLVADDSGKVTVDSSVRQYSGLRLPGPGEPGMAPALRADAKGDVSLWMLDEGDLAPKLTVSQAGDVGIGTTSPAAKLDVNGSLNVARAATLARLSVNGAASADANTVLTVRGQYYGEGHVFFYAHEGDGKDGTAYLQARDSTGKSKIAMRLRTQNANGVNEALHITPDGNVGIGTASPGAKLDVSGSLNVTGAATLANLTVSGNAGIGISDPKQGKLVLNGTMAILGANVTRFYNQPNDAYTEIGSGAQSAGVSNFWVRSSDAQRYGLFFDAKSGNVGIGTTGPGERLEVAGNLKINGDRIRSADGLGIVQTNAKDWLRINPDEQYPALALYKAVAIGSGGLAVGEWLQLPVGQLKVSQSAFLATAAGGVGIGTAALGGKLNINADGTTAGGWYEAIRFSQGAHSAITHPGGGLLFGLHSDRNFYFADITGGEFRKYVMQINAAAGDVTMNYNLSVAGALNFGSAVRQMINLYDTRYGIGIQTNTQYYRTALNFAWYKGGAHSNNEFDAGGGTVQMVIRDGNVGIGTASPAAKLDVSGNLTVRGQYYGEGHVYFYAHEGDGRDGTAYLQARDSTNKTNIAMRLRTQNGNGIYEALHITPDGNVGIGTTSPAAKLDVSGRIMRWSSDFSSAGVVIPGGMANDKVPARVAGDGQADRNAISGSVYPPVGTINDWNIIVSPRLMGYEENTGDGDNALIAIECYAVANSATNRWDIVARYKFRFSGDNQNSRWYYGAATYILVPR